MKIIIYLLTIFIVQTRAREWFENANFYQIYPKSYADADNDGTGDLKGIISKVSYIKDLGMDAVWLSPIFNSSWKDGGYDISNFREIDPIFGTMEDFQKLSDACKTHGLALIMDFVPNHSSNENEWFIKSEKNESGYEDFYVWHPGKVVNGIRVPPSNWLSGFGGSAWEWSEIRKEYYYHMFSKEQPDLNYRSASVQNEMKNVLKFWLDKGVGGFRVDAVQHLYEADVGQDGNYPDEPLSGNCDPSSHCYLNHIYTQNYPEMYEVVYDWRQLLDTYKDFPRIMMTEAYTTLDNLIKYYGNENRNGSQIPFNFEVLQAIDSSSTGKKLKIVSENYMNHIPDGQSPNWVLGNHDKRRIASRLGKERADLYNIYLQTMPGYVITYQGEEIAMEDGFISWNDTQDPAACNTNPDIYEQVTRDPARTPMQWNNGTNAGFNNGTKTWLPVASNYVEVNVDKQQRDSVSHLKTFKKLVELHKKPAFRNGFYESAHNHDENLYSYLRHVEDETYLIALNFAKQNIVVNLSSIYRSLEPHGDVVVASLNSNFKESSHIHTDENIIMNAESGFVLKLNGASTIVVSFITLASTIILNFFRNFNQ